MIHGLALSRLVPLGIAADAAGGEVGCHAAIISPVVHKVDDELDAVLLSSFDDCVKALKTVGTSVYGCCGAREGLEVHCAGTWDGGNIIEAPYTKYLLLGSSQVAHDDVDIVVIGEEGDPITVGASIVWME